MGTDTINPKSAQRMYLPLEGGTYGKMVEWVGSSVFKRNLKVSLRGSTNCYWEEQDNKL